MRRLVVQRFRVRVARYQPACAPHVGGEPVTGRVQFAHGRRAVVQEVVFPLAELLFPTPKTLARVAGGERAAHIAEAVLGVEDKAAAPDVVGFLPKSAEACRNLTVSESSESTQKRLDQCLRLRFRSGSLPPPSAQER